MTSSSRYEYACDAAMKRASCLDALAKDLDKGTKKKFRAKWMPVDEEALANKLRPLAEKKKSSISWKWGGTHFGATAAGPGGDRVALANSVDVLFPIATEARNGYPCLKGLRSCLFALDVDLDIMENKQSELNPKGTTPDNACLLAAVAWKDAMRQVLVLRKSEVRVADVRLQALIDYLIPSVEEKQDESVAAEAPADIMSASGSTGSGIARSSNGTSMVPIPIIQSQRGLDVVDECDDDIEFCEETCKRPLCLGGVVVIDDDVDAVATKHVEDGVATKHVGEDGVATSAAKKTDRWHHDIWNRNDYVAKLVLLLLLLLLLPGLQVLSQRNHDRWCGLQVSRTRCW